MYSNERRADTKHEPQDLPVMITRLMISLRKAAHLQGTAWSMGESTVTCGPGRETYGMRFVSNRGVSNRQDDDILLSPISPGCNGKEGGQLTIRWM